MKNKSRFFFLLGIMAITSASIAFGATTNVTSAQQPHAKVLPAKGVVKPARPATVTVSKIVEPARALLRAKDYVGFRIWVQKSYPLKITVGEWREMRNLINQYAVHSGFDLIPLWNARYAAGKSDIDHSLEVADRLMLESKFSEAFDQYQVIAQKLKKMGTTRGDARRLNWYTLHAMGRALYGAGRYDESVQVYQWITPNYPRFRQVLFEKMWAAFRAGRVELALGAIASQRSVYFSRFISPESYVIQVYLYKKLCREDDLKQVIAEMDLYQANLEKDGFAEWLQGDIELLTLSQLDKTPERNNDLLQYVSRKEREVTQGNLRLALRRAFDKRRPMLQADLRTVMAYAHLAKVTDTRDILKPVTALKSRDELLKQNLEVWPADTTEEWIDELGQHVFIGESLCKGPQ